MVRQVSIHDDDVLALGKLKSMNVGSTEAQFAGSGFENNSILAVNKRQLLGNILCSIRRGVIDNDNLILVFSIINRGKLDASN